MLYLELCDNNNNQRIVASSFIKFNPLRLLFAGSTNGKVCSNKPRSEEEDLEETIQQVLSSVSTAGLLREKRTIFSDVTRV
jgi:hypothetical protein